MYKIYVNIKLDHPTQLHHLHIMSAEQPRHLPDKELDKIVLNYLTQKGYKHTELMFRNEIRAHAGEDYSMDDMNAVSGYQFFPTDPDSSNPDSYISSYADLRTLIERSMDLYKVKKFLEHLVF